MRLICHAALGFGGTGLLSASASSTDTRVSSAISGKASLGRRSAFTGLPSFLNGADDSWH